MEALFSFNNFACLFVVAIAPIFKGVILNKVKDPRPAQFTRAASSFSIQNRFRLSQ